ncbi:MAG: fluoride efflux transporter CrcB [Anaerolineae bacterium]|nr:fluoride efflux transporter CrcB [Anaerolineae bacterium]
MDKLLLVGTGGFIGANTRYLFGIWLMQIFGNRFPVATLVINLTGSFMLGFFLTWAAGRTSLPEQTRLLIATGFCGGYTTFSTYAFESITLLRGGEATAALVYIIGTNLLCLVAVAAGMMLAGR